MDGHAFSFRFLHFLKGGWDFLAPFDADDMDFAGAHAEGGE